MPLPTWDALAKNQTDPQLIAEAITAYIDEHNNDENAHIGVGQSLKSHKASEIIDHLATSIIADKIKDREIFPKKILDYSWRRHSLALDSLDGWSYAPAGVWTNVGDLNLDTGAIINTLRYAQPDTMFPVSFDRNFIADFAFNLLSITNQIFYIVVGGSDSIPENQAIGFKVLNGTLYAYILSGDVEASETHLYEISGINLTIFHLYSVKFYVGNRVEFYVDDVLKHTITENLPYTSWYSGPVFSVRLKNTEAAIKRATILRAYFSAPYNA